MTSNNKRKPIHNTQGKLIVFEGADGTGKTTQAKLLYKYLQKKEIPAVLTSFPRYESGWGKMIRRYLNGEFGQVGEVNPYLASMLYAGDRLLAKDEIKKWIDGGKVVVCDRYVASNIGHQSAKIPAKGWSASGGKSQSEKSKFINWLERLEYRENKIPEPDLVILLTIPTEVAQKFMAKKNLDIHERDVSYQKKVADVFEDYAKGKSDWIKVSNVKDGKLRSLEEVSQEIIGSLKTKEFI